MTQRYTDRFVAIAVGQGDAFFFNRDDRSALIDGGRSEKKFPAQFQKATNQKYVDYLICTHNDDDHAKGLIGLLNSSCSVREVWLPASWTLRLNDMINKPDDFYIELIQKINDEYPFNYSSHYPPTLYQLGNYFSQKNNIEKNKSNLNIEEYIRKIFDHTHKTQEPQPITTYLKLDNFLSEDHYLLFKRAISAADNIKKIFSLSNKKQIKIRFFDYIGNTNKVATGGEPNFLVPVNSEEIFNKICSKIDAVSFITLTTSNKESLVFLAPNEKYPSILFTADSDLGFKQSINWSNGMLITAPHHGSENNKAAYTRFQNETINDINDVIWVRSDGKFKRNPGPSYKKQTRRYCTICNPYPSNIPKQNLVFTVQRNKWNAINTNPCTC